MPKSSKRIRPTDVTRDSSKISRTEVGPDKKVAFNFNKLQNLGKKFCYDKCRTSYFTTLLSRLKVVSGMTKKQMTSGRVKGRTGLRCHRIRFSDPKVSEITFGLGGDIDEEAWQFQLTKRAHGRVHGYFVENVFYIRWLDPKHELYPRKN